MKDSQLTAKWCVKEPTLGLKVGDILTVKRAKELGFKHAKIDREAGK